MTQAIHLHTYAPKGQKRLDLVSKEDWDSALADFAPAARYDAANLAAHNWDVVVIGDRLLVCCAWVVGDWWTRDGKVEKACPKMLDKLYPVAQPEEYNQSTTGFDDKRRLYKISAEGLQSVSAQH